MSKDFDEVVRRIEREETRGQSIDWRRDLGMATRIVERVDELKKTLPESQRDELAKALERSVHLSTGREDGERLRDLARKEAGPGVALAYAEPGKSYTGRVVSMNDRHALQEQKDKPGHLVAHDRQALSGAKVEVGKDVEIRYPHGQAGLVREGNRETGREAGREQQRQHEAQKATKQAERER